MHSGDTVWLFYLIYYLFFGLPPLLALVGYGFALFGWRRSAIGATVASLLATALVIAVVLLKKTGILLNLGFAALMLSTIAVAVASIWLSGCSHDRVLTRALYALKSLGLAGVAVFLLYVVLYGNPANLDRQVVLSETYVLRTASHEGNRMQAWFAPEKPLLTKRIAYWRGGVLTNISLRTLSPDDNYVLNVEGNGIFWIDAEGFPHAMLSHGNGGGHWMEERVHASTGIWISDKQLLVLGTSREPDPVGERRAALVEASARTTDFIDQTTARTYLESMPIPADGPIAVLRERMLDSVAR